MYEVIYTGQFQILIKPYSHIQKLFLQLFGGFTFSFYLCARSLNHADAHKGGRCGMRTYI